MAETNSDETPEVGIAPMGDAGDTSSAAGDALGIPGERNEGDATPENAPGGPSAGNTLGNTVGTGPAGGPQDTRISNDADV